MGLQQCHYGSRSSYHMTMQYVSLVSADDDVDGRVHLQERFRRASRIEQLDLLGDWIATLEALRAYLGKNTYADDADVRGDSQIVLNSDGVLVETVGAKLV